MMRAVLCVGPSITTLPESSATSTPSATSTWRRIPVGPEVVVSLQASRAHRPNAIAEYRSLFISRRPLDLLVRGPLTCGAVTECRIRVSTPAPRCPEGHAVAPQLAWAQVRAARTVLNDAYTWSARAAATIASPTARPAETTRARRASGASPATSPTTTTVPQGNRVSNDSRHASFAHEDPDRATA